MTPIVLTGAIPGLLRRGSPVVKTWDGDDDDPGFTSNGIVLERLPDDAAGERWRCWFTHPRIGLDIGFPPHLDLTDPLGLHTAVLWLRERGHKVPEAWPIEAVAWSVLSVSREGPMLAGVDDVPKFVNTRSALTQFCGATLWWTATEPERDFFLGPTRPDGSRHHGWYWDNHAGQEVGDNAIQTVCNLALAACYALRNPDGTLTLPELPNGH